MRKLELWNRCLISWRKFAMQYSFVTWDVDRSYLGKPGTKCGLSTITSWMTIGGWQCNWQELYHLKEFFSELNPKCTNTQKDNTVPDPSESISCLTLYHFQTFQILWRFVPLFHKTTKSMPAHNEQVISASWNADKNVHICKLETGSHYRLAG